MEYRNLVTFLRVAELQNFTKAANQLGYAQSTVTFHIQSLEEELGVTLFDRIGKKVTLTSAGEYLVTYANEMMKILTEIRQLNDSVDVMSGKLRVGVVESVLGTFMPDTVVQYNQKFPNVELEIQSHTTSTLLEMLRANDLDIAVVMGKRIVDPDFKRPLIKRAGISFVTYPGNPILKKEDLTFADIAQEQLVLPEKQSLYRRAVENAAAEYDCVLSPTVQVNNTALIIKLLKKGMGISYLPNYLIKPELESGDLVVLNLENAVKQEYYIQVLYHMKKWLTPQMKEYVTLMQELLKGEEDA